jgi:4-amino-4-deoxy-L-arabinose transferase-like glycosyltransferase
MFGILKKQEDQTRIFLMGAFLFCSLSMLFYVLSPPGALFKENDSNGYRKITQHFLKNKKFNLSGKKLKVPIHPRGYPVFLSTLMTISGGNFYSVILMQVLLTLLSIFLLMRIAQLLFGQDTVYWTCLLASCNLGYLIYAQYWLMETLTVFFLTLFFERFITFLKNKNNFVLTQGGLILGISIFIKPIALYYPMIVGVCLFFYQESYKDFLKSFCSFIVAFAIPVASLMSYNYLTYGVFTVSVTLNQNIYSYFLPQIIAIKKSITIEKARRLVGQELGLTYFRHNVVFAIPYILKNLILAIRVWGFNMMKTFCGLYSIQIKVFFEPLLKGGEGSFFNFPGSWYTKLINYCSYGTSSFWLQLITLLEFIWMIIRFYLLGLFFVILFSEKRYNVLLFFLLSILYFVGITGHDGMARYRMMVEPLLILGSAHALVVMREWIKISINTFIPTMKNSRVS